MIEFLPTEWRSNCGRYAIRVWCGKWCLVLAPHGGNDTKTIPATSYDDAAKQARDHRAKLNMEKS